MVTKKPDVSLNFTAEKKGKILSLVDPLMLTDGQIQKVMDTLHKEMALGMSRESEKRKLTSLQMENTYVRSLLNGQEEGDFLALDLGGTNFRVLLCKMRAGKCESTSRNYNVPTPKLYGPVKGVFDHLAESIYKFLKEEDMLEERLPLGFTFSFPMVQESIKKGILVTWTKSFACPDGVGQDAVKLLENSLAERGDTNVDVVAVLNDTTGTLLAGSYLDHKCFIGLIMGTGCNAAYVESLDNMDKWDGEKDGDRQVVIDIEWGAFGDNGSLDFMKTEYDTAIDLNSNHVGSFTFEKLFAGHYIGDLARLVMLKLTKEGFMFKPASIPKLEKWGMFTAQHLSDIAKDHDGDLSNTHRVLKDLDLDYSTDDVSTIRYVCAALAIRASQVVSSTLAVLLNHMKRPECVIAIDGSLYRYHPHIHDMMTAWLAHLAPNVESKLILAEDGSGRGAAFVAAVAVRMRKEQTH